jgi:hypothetical protein
LVVVVVDDARLARIAVRRRGWTSILVDLVRLEYNIRYLGWRY